MRFCTILILIYSLLMQPCIVLAVENNDIKDFEAIVKLQSKDQYQYKKVNKKYNPYLITFTNKTDKTILLTTDTMLEFISGDNSKVVSESRRDIYRKTRSRDMGKYYGITLPCAAIGGGIIGITFGLGIPVALGVMILGWLPAVNSSKLNSNFVNDLYIARGLPLRMCPNETYQIRVLVPKQINLQDIVFTNLIFENDKTNTRYNLKIPVGVEL